MLDTPAHIYYKYEGVSPVGSHKPNTAVPQAFYNKEAGTKAMTTETGAGQWGSALAMACNFFDLDLEVYMVKISHPQKPYRRIMMETFGAQVYASPTDRTHAGRAVLAQDPDNPGSLGIAISEAVEAAATSGGTKKYALGSVLNHVLLHQTVIGEEALQADGHGRRVSRRRHRLRRRRLELRRHRLSVPAPEPDGGEDEPDHRRRAGVVPEPDHAARYTFDYGDTGGQRPRSSRCTRSATPSFRRASTPAACAITAWRPASARWWSRRHRGARRQAARRPSTPRCSSPRPRASSPRPRARTPSASPSTRRSTASENGEKKVIVFNLSGHGHFDMMAYEAYHRGQLQDYEYPVEKVAEAMTHLPKVPAR